MGLFTEIGSLIEAGTVEQIATVSSNISSILIPWVNAGLTLWVLAYAFAVIRGEAQEPINRFVWEIAKKAFILNLALTAGLFQSTIMADTESVTKQLTSAINTAGGGSCSVSGSDTAGIYAAVDCSYSKYAEGSQKIMDKSDELLWKDVPDDFFDKAKRFVSVAAAASIFLFVFIFYGFASVIMYTIIFLEVVVVRLSLTMLFAFAPLFIAALAFEPTKKYFEMWSSKLIYCVIFQSMVVLFVSLAVGITSGFIVKIVDKMMAMTDFTEYAMNCLASLSVFVILPVTLAFIFARLPGLAGDLTGGGGSSGGVAGFIGGYATRAAQMAMRAKGGAKPPKSGGSMQG